MEISRFYVAFLLVARAFTYDWLSNCEETVEYLRFCLILNTTLPGCTPWAKFNCDPKVKRHWKRQPCIVYVNCVQENTTTTTTTTTTATSTTTASTSSTSSNEEVNRAAIGIMKSKPYVFTGKFVWCFGRSGHVWEKKRHWATPRKNIHYSGW